VIVPAKVVEELLPPDVSAPAPSAMVLPAMPAMEPTVSVWPLTSKMAVAPVRFTPVVLESTLPAPRRSVPAVMVVAPV
jgi:hypothetical protein